jgi:hypothetical protein
MCDFLLFGKIRSSSQGSCLRRVAQEMRRICLYALLSGSLALNVEDKEVTPEDVVHVELSHWDPEY